MEYNHAMQLLADYLVDIGVSRDYAVSTAYGLMDRIRRHCWKECTDEINDVEQLRSITKFSASDKLILILCELKLLGKANGRYYVPTAAREAPEYLRKKWRSVTPGGYAKAISRSKGLLNKPKRKTPKIERQTEVADEKEKVTTRSQSPHTNVVKYWCERWEQRYRLKYPFTARDAKHIQQILQSAGTPGRAQRIIDRYLSCREQWYAGKGHKLGLLVSDLPKFSSEANGGNGKEIEYKGHGDSLIIE